MFEGSGFVFAVAALAMILGFGFVWALFAGASRFDAEAREERYMTDEERYYEMLRDVEEEKLNALADHLKNVLEEGGR